jgi:signal peptide peptidase SppA
MNVKLAAADFLAITGVVSCEPGHWQRALSVVEAARAGDLDDSGFRAAMGTSQRTAARPAPRSIAVLELYGILTPEESIFSFLGAGTSLRAFGQKLNAAVADPSITRIAVLVDSPGGDIRGVPEMAAAMRLARVKKPVLIAVSGMNCSAAYWITSNGSQIEATQSATIGGIGVYGERVSIARQLERDGIDVEVFSAGKYKAEGHEATPISDEERQARQATVDEAYTNFVNDVSFGRGSSSQTIRAGYGQGRAVTAGEAVRLRMIDRISLVEDSLARALSAPAGNAQARDLAWQREIETKLFELDLTSSSVVTERQSDTAWQNAIEREVFEMEISLLR